MNRPEEIKNIFIESLKEIIGHENKTALSGISLQKADNNKYTGMIKNIFSAIISSDPSGLSSPEMELYSPFEKSLNIFIDYYSKEENFSYLLSEWDKFQSEKDENKRAKIISEIWVPELSISDSDITSRWELKSMEENPTPLKPEEVAIQLNALYTLPEDNPSNIPENIAQECSYVVNNKLNHVADYDHPVPIFIDDKDHELVQCLDELEKDISFEKTKGVFAQQYRVPVIVSISMTHRQLDCVATKWVLWLLKEKNYQNMEFVVLTEEHINRIKNDLLGEDIEVFSVLGKYSRHFNALKYTQLILEKSHGIRGAFKIDTDEGIRSEDLYNASGKTWFQTLCHSYWGGNAVDYKGNNVNLAINEGEYINSVDIDNHGYEKARFMPEVKLPENFINPMVTFYKQYAQGKVTGLYNNFKSLDDKIAHPVVKGGGYGITNQALRDHRPFTLSYVGRAEDQQFYFYALTRGIKGIFHPELRIAHYKVAVQTSEKKLKGRKFLGDMYRLIIFQSIVDLLDVKFDIDPFPGLFAGDLARCQAYITLLVRTYAIAEAGDIDNAEYILTEGFKELENLKEEIDSGIIAKKLKDEENQWARFVQLVDNLDSEKVKDFVKEITI